MGFLLVTALVSGVVIFLGSSLLEWILKKVASKPMANLGPTATTLSVVAVMTVLYIYVMTRPAVVGPYEQWTFENIGGQAVGGVLVAGVKLLMGKTSDS